MQYKLNRDFTKLTETSGVLYAWPDCTVEIVTDAGAKPDTGFMLHGGVPFPFAATAIYARAAGSSAVLNVVAGKVPV